MTEQEKQQIVVWNRVVLSGIGICQGALHYILTKQWWLNVVDPTTLFALLILIWATPVVAVLLVRRTSWPKDILFSVAVGVVAALLYKIAIEFLGLRSGWSDWSRIGGGNFEFVFAYGVTFLLLLVIPIPFYQAARAEGQFTFPYRQLFLNAWTNKLVVLVAGFFLCISWLVLALWGGLFKLIGVEFFARIFLQSWFISIFTGAVFGLGVALSRERLATIQALLKLILTLFRVLAPILACIILLFLLAVPITGLEVLWNTKIASRILLSALFILIIFENAVIQAAETDNSFWRPAERIVMAANVAMPALAVLAGWALFLRVGQYGWTPVRYYMALLTGVALAYALAYAGSVIVKRVSWTDGIVRFNPILALGMLALAVFMHLPPLEPYGISASDQLSRLRDGRIAPEQFDFAFLRFKLGEAGRNALEKIENDEDLMKSAAVVENLNRAKALSSYNRYWNLHHSIEFSTGALQNVTAYMNIFPPSLVPPAAAIEEWVKNENASLRSCKSRSNLSAPRCAVIEIDLNGDGLKDVALLLHTLGLKTVLLQSDGSWKAGPYLRANRPPNIPIQRADLADAIKRGDILLVPHEFQDVIIGGIRFW